MDRFVLLSKRNDPAASNRHQAASIRYSATSQRKGRIVLHDDPSDERAGGSPCQR